MKQRFEWRFDGTRFTVSRFTVSRCLRNPTRRAMRNTETHRTTMRAVLSHVTATCEVFARANCNHGFSISQLHGDRDSANCRALPFEFPLVVDYERFVDKVSASRVSVCRSENRQWESERDKIFFASTKKILVQIERGASRSKLYRNKVQSFRRYR